MPVLGLLLCQGARPLQVAPRIGTRPSQTASPTHAWTRARAVAVTCSTCCARQPPHRALRRRSPTQVQAAPLAAASSCTSTAAALLRDIDVDLPSAFAARRRRRREHAVLHSLARALPAGRQPRFWRATSGDNSASFRPPRQRRGREAAAAAGGAGFGAAAAQHWAIRRHTTPDACVERRGSALAADVAWRRRVRQGRFARCRPAAAQVGTLGPGTARRRRRRQRPGW